MQKFVGETALCCPGPSGPASAENQPKGRFSRRFGPQTCARGLNPLDPYLANKYPGKKAATSACSLGRRKLVGFWPKKAGKIRWESKLSPSDSSPAFPGCKASGLAAFSRRARSTTAASLSLNEVQEMKSPGSGVQGAEEAPYFVYVHSCVSPGWGECSACFLGGFRYNGKGSTHC